MRLTLAIRSAGLALVMLVCACPAGETEDSSGYRGPVNECNDDGDCPEGSMCDTSLSLCAVTGLAENRRYYMKVIPRLNFNALEQMPEQVFEITLGPGIATPQKVRLFDFSESFSLKFDAVDRDDNRVALDVQITITDNGTGLPGESRTPTIALVSIPADSDGESLPLKLLPGENHNYQIKVVPTGAEVDTFPAHYFDNISITETGGYYQNPKEMNPAFHIYQARTFASGKIRRGSQPEDGLSVEAFDPDTGHVVSTRAVTDCAPGAAAGQVCGDFEIGFTREADRYSLRVWRENEPWYPEAIVENLIINQSRQEEGSNGGESTRDIGDIFLDPLGTPVKYNATVTRPIPVPNSDNADDGLTEYAGVKGVMMVFESDDLAGGHVVQGVFTNDAGKLEDDNGILGIELFPGSYDISVVPPDKFGESLYDYCVLNWENWEISGTSVIEGQEFRLQYRPTYTGRITAGGADAIGATVRAEPCSSATAFSRSSVASADSKGLYSVRVDKGQYRLTAEIPRESGYAWATQTTEIIEDDDMDFELPIPFTALFDLVVGSDDNPAAMGGATVEWYEEVDGRAFMVGRSTADANGRVAALLAP